MLKKFLWFSSLQQGKDNKWFKITLKNRVHFVCGFVFWKQILLLHKALNIKNENSIELESWKYTTSKVEHCARLCFKNWKSTLLK